MQQPIQSWVMHEQIYSPKIVFLLLIFLLLLFSLF